ncbi:MAG: hypothetical protein GY859_19765, partial [Desulfobacterales bacterium]|nr:hypothetical protein [Desulfobacterales bacterium]
MPKNRSRWAVIIDGADNDRPLERGQTAVYWSRFDVPGGAVSIPFLVNEDSVALRDEYLPLIHDMGEIRVDGKSVREHLKIGKGFSFWWLTMLAQKSPLKAP